jgi:hypothetical protein
MVIALTIQARYENNEDLISWIEAGMVGLLIAKKRRTRACKPRDAAEKEALSERMVKGQEGAAKRRHVDTKADSPRPAAAKRPAKQ